MTHAQVSSTALWLMLLLGAYHGINPGMGWLFAVALGMQEQKGSAVARSLLPIAFGHALAIASVVLTAAFLGTVLPLATIRYPIAAVLIGLGAYYLVWHHHPRWVRMQVGFRDLTVWSFLMASAHGAGLMLWPVLMPLCFPAQTVDAGIGPVGLALTGLAVHTAAVLAVTAATAGIVYEWLGLAALRHAWVNLDMLWRAALLTTGAMLVMSGAAAAEAPMLDLLAGVPK